MTENKTAGFTPPTREKDEDKSPEQKGLEKIVGEMSGNAEVPKNKGVVNKNNVVKKSEQPKKKVRDIEVVATQVGYFDHQLVEIDQKLTVAEEELSPVWMQRLDGKEIVRPEKKSK